LSTQGTGPIQSRKLNEAFPSPQAIITMGFLASGQNDHGDDALRDLTTTNPCQNHSACSTSKRGESQEGLALSLMRVMHVWAFESHWQLYGEGQALV
jgi:hypothetical protein